MLPATPQTSQHLAAEGWKCWRPGVTKLVSELPDSMSACVAMAPASVTLRAPLVSSTAQPEPSMYCSSSPAASVNFTSSTGVTPSVCCTVIVTEDEACLFRTTRVCTFRWVEAPGDPTTVVVVAPLMAGFVRPGGVGPEAVSTPEAGASVVAAGPRTPWGRGGCAKGGGGKLGGAAGPETVWDGGGGPGGNDNALVFWGLSRAAAELQL